MKTRLPLLALALSAPLVFAATALAASSPTTSAYGGSNSAVVQSVSTTQQNASSTLPFTGISVGAVVLIAAVLLATGYMLRRQVASSHD